MVQLSFKADLRYVLYSKENADFVCSSQITEICEFPVVLGQSTYMLLTSPIVDPVLSCALYGDLSIVHNDS